MLLLQSSVSIVLSSASSVLVEVKVCHAFPGNCLRFWKRFRLLETQCMRTGHSQPPSGALPANTSGAEAEEEEDSVMCDLSPVAQLDVTSLNRIWNHSSHSEGADQQGLVCPINATKRSGNAWKWLSHTVTAHHLSGLNQGLRKHI
jgi:hypothetical protein